MKLMVAVAKRGPNLHKHHGIKDRKAIAAVFTAILLMMFVGQIWFLADAIPITGPLVLQLGNDDVTRDSAKQLSQEIDNARLFQVSSIFELGMINRKAIGQLFYVGHGSDEGLQIGANIVPWDIVKTVVEKTPAKEHYFAACFSNNIGEVEGKLVLGFPSTVDADVASLLIPMTYHYVHGDFNSLMQLTRRFLEGDYLSKLVEPKHPLWTTTAGLLPGWTPYGLYSPPAVKIVLNAADYTYIVGYGTLGIALTTAIITLCTGGIGAIIAPFLMGMVISIVLIWATDKQGTAPYDYVEIWIPQDPINEISMLLLKYYWFRTTH